MTNTSIDMSPEQLDVYRADEASFLREARDQAEALGILRVGRFLSGGVGAYSAAYVLREIDGEFVTHMMVRADDRPRGVLFYFTSGHYFPDFGRANLDLENRY